jgi:hypothetical protein
MNIPYLIKFCVKIWIQNITPGKREQMARESSQFVSNIFMENSEKIALDTADYKHARWLEMSIHLWLGHMDQDNCSSFFSTSTALGIP